MAPRKPSEKMWVDRTLHNNRIFLQNEVLTAADVMLGIDNGGTWGSFTCTEIEALADIFRAVGRDDVADFIIAEHAESDEDDDLHTKEEPDE